MLKLSYTDSQHENLFLIANPCTWKKVSKVLSEKVSPADVVAIMGKKYGLNEVQAKTLIDFYEARERRDRKVHGAEAAFAHMREELGRVFPNQNERVDAVSDFIRMFT